MCLEANGDLSELTDRDESWSGLKPIKDRNLGRLTKLLSLAGAILDSDWRRAPSSQHHFESHVS